MKNPAITSNNLPAIGAVVLVRHSDASINVSFPDMFGEFTVSDIEYDDGKTFLHLFGRQFPTYLPNPDGANPEQWRLYEDAKRSGCTWVSTPTNDEPASGDGKEFVKLTSLEDARRENYAFLEGNPASMGEFPTEDTIMEVGEVTSYDIEVKFIQSDGSVWEQYLNTDAERPIVFEYVEGPASGPYPPALEYTEDLPQFNQGDTVYLNIPKEETRFAAFRFSPVNQSSPLTYEGIDEEYEEYEEGGYIVNVGFNCPNFGQITQLVHSSELSLTPSGDQRPDIIESFDELSTPPMETPAEPTAPMTRKVLEMFRAKGSVTALEAGGVLKCRSLPYQVFKLKELGHDISTEMKKDPMDGQAYARYHYIPAAA